MKKTNIGIIILNYLSYQETIKCVQYLKAQNFDKVKARIIVVDNNSNNGSFKKIKEKFKNDPMVVIVKTKRNLGFAEGNNYGYEILKKYFKSLDFVVVSNSDAYAKDKGLFRWIQNEYKKNPFGVLGPSIYSVRGDFFQSPMKNETRKLKEVRKEIKDLRRFLVKLHVKKWIKREEKADIPKWDNKAYTSRTTTKTLHGAFQVFSKDYLKKFNNLYDKRTFLYREEDIVKLRCDKEQLLMVYSPEYEVKHLQAISTSKASKSVLDQKIKRTKNLLNSTKVYEKVLKESNLAK